MMTYGTSPATNTQSNIIRIFLHKSEFVFPKIVFCVRF